MTDQNRNNITDFGFNDIPTHEKSDRVASIFHAVSNRYDLMNDLMSGSMHRAWKKFTLLQSGVRSGAKVLDVASGTGDLALGFLNLVGKSGKVVMTDINQSMLFVGRDRMLDRGIISGISYVQADAEILPFKNNYFDCVSIAFGLRNVTDKLRALKSMYKVLKPGGRLLILEFSKPVFPFLQKLYDKYSFNIIPKLGELICNDADSYKYLVESIRRHPDQKTLSEMMQSAGFEDVSWNNLSGGIVALHKGFRYE